MVWGAVLGAWLIGTLLVVAAYVVLDRSARPEGSAGASASPQPASPYSSGGSQASFTPLQHVARGMSLGGSFDAATSSVGRNLGLWLIGGWVMTLAECNGGGGGGGSDSEEDGELFQELIQSIGAVVDASRAVVAQTAADELFASPDMVFLGVALLAGVILGCLGIQLLLYVWLTPGWIRAHQESLNGQATFGTLFGGADRLVDLVVFRLVRWIVVVALPAIPLLLPVGAWFALQGANLGTADWSVVSIAGGLGMLSFVGLWTWSASGLALGNYLLVLDDSTAGEAVLRSLDAARGNRAAIILFSVVWAILQAVFALVGLLALCVGVLLTAPLARAAVGSAWTRAFLLARDGKVG